MANPSHTAKDKNIEAIYPLSPMQEGMLFHTLYDTESAVYFEQFSFEIKSQLNPEAFQKAWQTVVDRHPVFRTLFLWEKRSQPIQVVRKKVELPWVFYDWQTLSKEEQSQGFENLLVQDRKQGFDLKKAPLMRCFLIKISQDSYYFVWSSHHILSDGWCLPIVLKEVLDFYQAYTQGRSLSLPKPRPYKDYIAWLQKQDLKQAETFWKNQLQGFISPIPLGVDKLIATQTTEETIHQSQSLKLSNSLTDKLNQFTRQNRLTLNTIIQGVWAILLSRYSGETDIVFGATVSGRPPELIGVESMVGLFINTLPVRVKILNDVTVIDLLQTLRTQQVESEHYSYTPLVEIQRWSEIPKGNSLFESLLVFENYPIDESLKEENQSLKIEPFRSFEQTNYPLELLVVPSQELELKVSYDVNRFEHSTIERLIGHLQVLLGRMVNNPEEKVSKLPLLTESERHQILVEWNQTEVEYSKDKCIHQLFEEQVLKTPEAVAVVYEGKALTYQQLNEKANQLGHYLVKLEVKPDDLVGICVERSLEMIIGLLGILKAGGAYVPIDPNYPRERIEYMIKDSGVSVLLTQERLIELLAESEANVISLDRDWMEIEKESNHNFNSGVSSENLAYVIYTSGSTGKPKGVLINHQNVINHNYAIIEKYSLSQTDKVLQFASFNFDVAVEEILPTLLVGANLILSPLKVPSFEEFNRLINNYQLTVLNLPASYWYQWVLELNEVGFLSSLRLVIVGSESVPVDGWRKWQQLTGTKIPCYNAYGLSETTITATVYHPSESKYQTSFNALTVPIGKPINNTQVYVLDNYLQPVPIGVRGELYIGGDSIAKGYLNNSELTDERFISNPFSNDSQSKLYKTGDICHYLPDGNLEYIERKDFQVKIRGLRIELGEIETQLNSHPSVKQVVVIAIKNKIIAYLVSNLIPDRLHYVKPCQLQINNKTYQVQTEDVSLKGLGISHIPLEIPQNTPIRLSLQLPNQETPTELEGKITWYRDKRAGIELNLTSEQQETLKSSYQTLKEDLGIIPTLQRSLSQTLWKYLKGKLPEYMIPSSFVLLEKLPLTPNGKIDRKALPDPDYHWLSQTEDFAPPQTPQEEILAEIWSELLRLETISINSNFFELGGDSILTIQVVARARQAGLKITPKQLFEHQTIAQLALVAQTVETSQAEQGLITGIATLTPIEHWFFEQNLPEAHHWNQAVLIEIDNNIDLNALTKTFNHLLEHHDALRLRFTQTETGWQQYYSESVETLTLEEIDLSNLTPDEQTKEIENQGTYWQSSLNLEQGPIIRFVIFKLGNNQPHRLLIVIHHLAVDGISWRILLEDLVTAYQQIKENKTPQLPLKTTSYKQWGEKLIEYAQTEEIKTELKHWLSLTNNTYHPLPIDKKDTVNPNTETSAINLTFSLSEQETQSLLQDVPSAYNTQINDILLTALVQSFSQWTGQPSLLLDLEGHGREDLFEGIDLSRTVGWFTSVFPVGLNLSNVAKNELGEAIKTIKEQLRQIPNKGVGYGILKYLSTDENIKQNLSKIPNPQISFNYLGQFDQIVSSPPLLKFASESSGHAHSLQGKRSHLIDINSIIVGGKLETTWTYSKNAHESSTIEVLGQSYVTALQSLINHCLSDEAGGFTPSDFPAARVSQQQLDRLLKKLQKLQEVV